MAVCVQARLGWFESHRVDKQETRMDKTNETKPTFLGIEVEEATLHIRMGILTLFGKNGSGEFDYVTIERSSPTFGLAISFLNKYGIPIDKI